MKVYSEAGKKRDEILGKKLTVYYTITFSMVIISKNFIYIRAGSNVTGPLLENRIFIDLEKKQKVLFK